MRNFARSVVIVLAAALIGGCAGQQIKTPREGVAACYYSVRAGFDTAAQMKARGKLSEEQRVKALAAGDKALAVCDAARTALAAGDVATAESQLKSAELILLQLEAALK